LKTTMGAVSDKSRNGLKKKRKKGKKEKEKRKKEEDRQPGKREYKVTKNAGEVGRGW